MCALGARGLRCGHPTAEFFAGSHRRRNDPGDGRRHAGLFEGVDLGAGRDDPAGALRPPLRVRVRDPDDLVELVQGGMQVVDLGLDAVAFGAQHGPLLGVGVS